MIKNKEKTDSGKKQNNNGWISVEDRLPNDEDDVLVLVREVEHYGIHKEKTKVYHWIFTGWRIDDVWATTYCHGHKKIEDENKEYSECEHTVTHWMPLPELPKEKRLMRNGWNKITDGLPPVGVPLIVTVKDGLQGRPNTLRYPVYYEKAKDGLGYRWSWRFGDYDYDLVPEVSKVIGWMEMPEPLEVQK